MSLSIVWDLITGSGVAGAFIILFLTNVVYTKGYVDAQREMYEAQIKDRDAQIAEKNEAIRIERDRADAERRRADGAVESVHTNNILLAAITGHKEIGAA